MDMSILYKILILCICNQPILVARQGAGTQGGEHIQGKSMVQNKLEPSLPIKFNKLVYGFRKTITDGLAADLGRENKHIYSMFCNEINIIILTTIDNRVSLAAIIPKIQGVLSQEDLILLQAVYIAFAKVFSPSPDVDGLMQIFQQSIQSALINGHNSVKIGDADFSCHSTYSKTESNGGGSMYWLIKHPKSTLSIKDCMPTF